MNRYMAESRELIKEIRQDLQKIDREIREHSYPAYFKEQHPSEENYFRSSRV